MVKRVRRLVTITMEHEHHDLAKRMAQSEGIGLSGYLEALVLKDAKRKGHKAPTLRRRTGIKG